MKLLSILYFYPAILTFIGRRFYLSPPAWFVRFTKIIEAGSIGSMNRQKMFCYILSLILLGFNFASYLCYGITIVTAINSFFCAIMLSFKFAHNALMFAKRIYFSPLLFASVIWAIADPESWTIASNMFTLYVASLFYNPRIDNPWLCQ